MMKNTEGLQKKGMLFLLVMAMFLWVVSYVGGASFFTTNSSTDYNWSAGIFLKTEISGELR